MSLVRETLIQEFKTKAKIASELKAQIDSAKTYPKKEMLKRKLKKNNTEAADLLGALETLMRETTKTASGDENDRVTNEGRIEAPNGVPTSLE
jgi:hypothetical protein